jgi:hypothetical protein
MDNLHVTLYWMEKNWNISSKVRKQTKMSILPFLIQCSTETPSHVNKARERNKKNLNRKWRSQIIPICNDIILNLQDPENATKKTPRSHKHFKEVARYKIKIQKISCFSIYQQRTHRLRKKSGKQFHSW